MNSKKVEGTHIQLRKDIDLFLKSGGNINRIPEGTSTNYIDHQNDIEAETDEITNLISKSPNLPIIENSSWIRWEQP